MELKNKIQQHLLLLENDKNEAKRILLEWSKFLKISTDDIKIVETEKCFNKILSKIKDIENAYTDDLEQNETSFSKFFDAGVRGGTDCYEDMYPILDMIEQINKEIDESEKVEKVEETEKEVTLEQLVEQADKVYFLRFAQSVYKFYVDMHEILDVVFDYAKKLYIYHTGDVTVGGTEKL